MPVDRLGSAHRILPRGLERRVTPFGNSAKVDCPKKYPLALLRFKVVYIFLAIPLERKF
ncbi:hypothetical protein DRP07_05420 [Archaeoglobales archaeon]|nr:MAG: hypothetical protein DRP07_05420 [Archaeoglobales archaeon]